MVPADQHGTSRRRQGGATREGVMILCGRPYDEQGRSIVSRAGLGWSGHSPFVDLQAYSRGRVFLRRREWLLLSGLSP